MRILWQINIALPVIAEKEKLKVSPFGGWVVGLSNSILDMPNIELAVCFPLALGEKKKIKGKIGNLTYYAFPRDYLFHIKYKKSVEIEQRKIIDDFAPDIVHIFGTEFAHSLSMTYAFSNPNKTIVNIQGLASICSKHYFAGLPNNIIKKWTIRELVKGENIKKAAKRFEERGKFEIQTLKNVNHIIGRTDWDKACTFQINPNANYHFCNETLRDEFYMHSWKLEKCQRYSIFLSQAGYPIKGLHYVLEALPEIIKNYPDTHLYIAGNNIIYTNGIKNKLNITSYGMYIRKLIIKNNLSNYITFMGILHEKQICRQFLKSHVFASPSSIENSSNSIGEATILGVPVVASYVGGITSSMCHGTTGYIYQHDAPYMLAYYVCKIFGDDKLALHFSENAKRHANIVHHKENNLNEMIKIYKNICST